MRRLWKISIWSLGVLITLAVAGLVALVMGLWYFGKDLPDYRSLADYQPPVTTRIYTSDGQLLEEFARQQRLFVPIEAMPARLKQAFIAAEDQNFYTHHGLDYIGVARAMLTNLSNLGSDRRLVGASTITQQVAKNFLLTNEVSYQRKIREAILAYRIEQAYEKDEILELYLNEIYLGRGAYGVAAAALNYFGKSLDELQLDEIAYLAALPKAPNNYHPTRKTAAAVARRNWVLGRMEDERFISQDLARSAATRPLTASGRSESRFFDAAFFNEEVRRQLYQIYGEDELYEGGLAVQTTLDPRLQEVAEKALRDGLIAYDRRHGWRGPVARFDSFENWRQRLDRLDARLGRKSWRKALVMNVSDDGVKIGLADGGQGFIPFEEMRWARPHLPNQRFGTKPEKPSDVVSAGDVIVVEALTSGSEATNDDALFLFGLRQIPDVEGAIVALDPHTGRVLAMVGGFDYRATQFNRATQAKRQPGSAFKPFVYAAALENGFTPSDLILDGPFVIDQGYGLGKWKPENYSNKFYGPSTLRLGVEKSRNLMTVRLAQKLGMDVVADYGERFGIYNNLQQTLAMALGAQETTVLELTAAYGMLVNGGKAVTPTLIDRIQDRRGKTVYRHDNRQCASCSAAAWAGQTEPELPDARSQVIAAPTAYQVTSMLEGVVERGTGRRIRAVGKPLAGKTGTTNDSNDSWFVGFSPDLAVGVFVGFDTPRTLGKKETGSSVAAPIFREFMQAALADQPGTPFRIPEGIRLVRVNAETGLPAQPGERNVILEAFRSDSLPSLNRVVLDGSMQAVPSDRGRAVGTGGLY